MINFDNVPVIPKEEYPERWKRIQDFMEKKEIDLIFAYSNDSAVFGNAHARWMLNFQTHFEPVAVLINRSGNPVLLCGPESDKYALRSEAVTDVRVLWEFTHPDEDYPFSKIYKLRDIVSDIAGDIGKIKRVGIAAKGLMPHVQFKAFEAAIPKADWIDVESDLCALRAVKSKAEIEVIRYAYKIAEMGFNAAISTIKPGVTEREVAAAIECAMRSAGSEGTGIDTIVASGDNSRPILGRSSFKKIKEKELIVLTVVPRFQGYHGAIGRAVTVGEPDMMIKQALEVAADAQTQCYKAMKAGVEGRVVEALGRKIVTDGGFGNFFLYSGLHSVGVSEFEPPIFGPSHPAKLQENMIISIDIPMFNAPWGGLRIEDGYLINKDSAEKLNHIPLTLVL